MNLKDHLAEILLSLFDALMNIITLGIWSHVRGAYVPKIKNTEKAEIAIILNSGATRIDK